MPAASPRSMRGWSRCSTRNGLPSTFNGMPSEIADAVPFADDRAPRAYDRDSRRRGCARRWPRCCPVVRAFPRRLRRQGAARSISGGAASTSPSPASPAGTAPPHPGGIPGLPDRITREAYSHEVSSAGFWAGGVARRPSRSSTATPIPNPHGFRDGDDRRTAQFDETLGEFISALRRRPRVAATRTPCSPTSSSRPTTPPPTSRIGTAPRSGARRRSRPRLATNG